MSKYLVLIVACLLLSVNTFAQKGPNDYSFVVVPERFDFQAEKDQFQLNSLTKFLFNKHGFNAYFNAELPNVSRCDGLWADVQREDGFVWTRLTVILNDCNGDEVYRSSIGKSKDKEYKKAYFEAMRQAFESIEAEQFQQPEPKIYADFEEKTEKDEVKISEVKESEPSVDDTSVIETKVATSEVNMSNMEFVSGNYSLLKVDDQYQILQNGNNIGRLIPTSKANLYLVKTQQFFGVAYKTNTGFTIEKINEESDTPELMKFSLKN
ncbi:MAG: hypothetical protein HKN48_02435 [Flavobacteriaceae bacterium]|nr:hypothetical protein [Flavobacteriaceae bacterium]